MGNYLTNDSILVGLIKKHHPKYHMHQKNTLQCCPHLSIHKLVLSIFFLTVAYIAAEYDEKIVVVLFFSALLMYLVCNCCLFDAEYDDLYDSYGSFGDNFIYKFEPKSNVAIYSATDEFRSESDLDLPPGLDNEANLCFLNSVIQCISSLPKLCKAVALVDTNHSEVEKHHHSKAKNSHKPFVLFQELLCYMHFSTRVAISPYNFAREISNSQSLWQFGEQQDADMARLAINNMLEESLGENFTKSLFGINMRTEFCISPDDEKEKHGKITPGVTTTCFSYFVPFPKNQKDADNEIRLSDSLNQHSQWCKLSAPTEKGFLFKREVVVRLPTVLCFHLQRFDKEGNVVCRALELEEKLNVGECLDKSVWDGSEWRYILHGLILHQGTNIGDGHFYSYVKGSCGWIKCDDFLVTRTTFDDIVDDCCSGLRNSVHSLPYLVFYKRDCVEHASLAEEEIMFDIFPASLREKVGPYLKETVSNLLPIET